MKFLDVFIEPNFKIILGYFQLRQCAGKVMLLIILFLVNGLFAASDTSTFNQLYKEVENAEVKLQNLIQQAESKGLNTESAEISVHTIDLFKTAAKWDFENFDKVHDNFSHYWRIKEPRTTEEARRLPFNELKACMEVATYANSELELQLEGKIKLAEHLNLKVGQVRLGKGYYEIDGRPFFPSSLIWMPKKEEYLNSFGRIGQRGTTLARLSPQEHVWQSVLDENIKSAQESAANNLTPYVFFNGHSPAKWMIKQHFDIVHGARHFTKYDIDSPHIRTWFMQLCESQLPKWSGALPEGYPRMHMLANEPHFATARGGWLAKEGLSDHTMVKYRTWLKAKYQEIDRLNELYGTSYSSFSEVIFYDGTDERYINEPWRARQIDMGKTRGGPVWYDWCSFNQHRVNEWFSFLKEHVQANDGVGAPVTIKMLGFTLSRNTRDGGMDIEYLTNLQDVIGADLRVAPLGAEFFGKHEEGINPETSWMNYFAYDWSEQSMYLDFSKSLCPEKAFYDSEWHGFSSVSWRHFNISRNYVRSSIWMAFLDGMSMIKPWFWGRASDGAIKTNKSYDLMGQLPTQPVALDAYGRVMKELNSHAAWLAPGVMQQKRHIMIYYCEESAIQDEGYTSGFKSAYEAIKMLNIGVGFATPSTVTSLSHEEQIVLLTPTQFIKDESITALQDFQQKGGKVILIGDSFQYNEYGEDRNEVAFLGEFIRLKEGSMVSYISDFREVILPLIPASLLQIKINDELGNNSFGVYARQFPTGPNGGVIVVLNNLSKDARVVQLKFPDDVGRPLKDMISQDIVSGELNMKPLEVRILSMQVTQ